MVHVIKAYVGAKYVIFLYIIFNILKITVVAYRSILHDFDNTCTAVFQLSVVGLVS